MLCDYYSSPIEPEDSDISTEIQSTAVITYSGTKPTIKVGGSWKTFTSVFDTDNVTVEKWLISDDNGDVSADDYIIEYNNNQLKIKVAQNYYLIGRTLVIQVIGSDNSKGELKVEVIG
jgi:hypothetical protein